MSSHKSKNHLVWIDLEMTGLDPEKESIIEIASIITDGDLNLVAEGPNLVIHQGPKLLKAMDDWNQKHHKKSGLLDKVKKSKLTMKKAEEKTLKFIKKYCLPKQSPLCGNSIDQDRRFLIKYMPKLNDYLHYRQIDVSTLKALVRLWYPKDKNLPKKSEAHRALSDIKESVEELQYYRKVYFKSKTELN